MTSPHPDEWDALERMLSERPLDYVLRFAGALATIDAQREALETEMQTLELASTVPPKGE